MNEPPREIERSRALLTETDRELIATTPQTENEENRRYQAISRVRKRLDELDTDIKLLATHHPRLLAEIQTTVHHPPNPDDLDTHEQLESALESTDHTRRLLEYGDIDLRGDATQTDAIAANLDQILTDLNDVIARLIENEELHTHIENADDADGDA